MPRTRLRSIAEPYSPELKDLLHGRSGIDMHRTFFVARLLAPRAPGLGSPSAPHLGPGYPRRNRKAESHAD
jgi:hypothetical protein